VESTTAAQRNFAGKKKAVRDNSNGSKAFPWCHALFSGLPWAGWQPLGMLTFLLPAAAHHLPDGGLGTRHTAAPKVLLFPFHPEDQT